MAIDTVPRGDVRATLNFFAGPEDGSAPYNLIVPQGLPGRNYSDDPQEALLHDIRGRESDFNLDHDAFAVIRNQPPSAEKDFVDDESIQQNYYPELEKLLLEHVPGSNRVLFFDHTVRRADPKANRNPVTRVHIDQTPVSVIQRVKKHLPEEADKLLAGRYRIINVWRPLNKNPVESFPLGFASSSTLDDADIVPIEHRYSNGYTGQTAGIKFSPNQKWYYLSGMTGDERLLLECFDSEGLRDGTGVHGGRLAHTAFVDPRTRPDAEGRESIEVRALVFGP
ncbi:7alpha-cephem-methoxylase p8 chain related protein [Colletotrichum truncatum]|uniref:7alpha-cephem-methoxylase p8 chain related protein n=1 Tax=Colletotrichum truncatum TaxID=5467 RepID=A0ACC3ZAD9_COLTU|nr:7alpha-cephem-methoxylase p8 chain related protein [Colletotrichum truncatum]KAF6796182.1 7alpha-cephem-methoxylase p8 chain related protein [Colletotrichum truncatum]